MGRPYTEQEDAIIRKHYAIDMSGSQIARQFGRTTSGVQKRAQMLGCIGRGKATDLRIEFLDGILSAYAKAPSMKEFAASMGVSKNTAAKWVYTARRR